MPAVRHFSRQEEAQRAADPAALAFLDALFEQADVGVGIWDRDLRYERVNPALAAMNGLPEAEHVGRTVRDVVPELAAELESMLGEVLRSGEAVTGIDVVGETPAEPGSERVWRASYYPLRRGDDIVGVGAVVVEITARQRAEAALERREREVAFLADASAVLGSSLNHRSTLQTAARLAVPAVADWCVIDLVQDDGSIRRVAIAHADPEKEPLAWDLTRRFPSGPHASEGTPKAIRAGRTELVKEVDESFLQRMAVDAEHLAALRELGMHSIMIVPLRARGRTLGALALVSSGSGRRFDEQDIVLAEDLAGRCATAIDNARLFGERAYIARALQRSLLPPTLPAIPGFEVAARYRPAGEGNEVGGDFYDVFPIAEGFFGAAIGDVSGKGPDAAAVTALARHTLHVAATYEERPSHVLATLNDALLEDTPRPLLTAAYARVATTRPATIEVASGGHPLPLVLHPDGRVEPVGESGTILGFAAVPSLHDRTLELAPGDAVVFYTDGIIESRPIERSLGEEGLAVVLSTLAGLGADQIAGALEIAVEERSGGRPQDDVAIVVLQLIG